MRLTRRIALVSLTLSILGLGQPTFADSSNDNYSTSGQQTECSGGPSDHFRLVGLQHLYPILTNFIILLPTFRVIT